MEHLLHRGAVAEAAAAVDQTADRDGVVVNAAQRVAERYHRYHRAVAVSEAKLCGGWKHPVGYPPGGHPDSCCCTGRTVWARLLAPH